MFDEIEIVDVNGEKRNVMELKVVNNEGEDFVEVLIRSKNGERFWKEFYQLARFQELNPKIILYRK
jgi:hypothetical protein